MRQIKIIGNLETSLLMEQKLTLTSAVPVEIDQDMSLQAENKVHLALSFPLILFHIK
jgi:hypothetical protein